MTLRLKFTDKAQALQALASIAPGWDGITSPHPIDLANGTVVHVSNETISIVKWLESGSPEDENQLPALPEITGFHVDLHLHLEYLPNEDPLQEVMDQLSDYILENVNNPAHRF